MKKYLSILVLLLIATTANAGFYGIVDRTATRDTLSFSFQFLDTLGEAVDAAANDSVYIIVNSPGGTEVFRDSMQYDDGSITVYAWEDFAGGDHYNYEERVSILDGSSTADGVFSVHLVAWDNSLELQTHWYHTFQIVNSTLESSLDSAGVASLASLKALDSLADVLDSLETISTWLQDSVYALLDTLQLWDTRIDSMEAALADAAIGSKVWDALLTGATYNIATSAGRRLRGIAPDAISTGTAQASDGYTIGGIDLVLASAESAGDDFYNGNILYIESGTGLGQTRMISDYTGAADSVTLHTGEGWTTAPDNTSVYNIVSWSAQEISHIHADALSDIQGEVWDATLDATLKSLTISNSGGSALTLTSTGSNGHGLLTSGDGSGHGIYSRGDPSGGTGEGIYALGGATSGRGIYALGGGAGDGMIIQGQGGQHGLNLIGQGTGSALIAAAGATGYGFKITGGATSGHGVWIQSDGSGNGLVIDSGAVINGKVAGTGLAISGGSTSGVGLSVTAVGGDGVQFSSTGGNNNGLQIIGDGSGYGLEIAGDPVGGTGGGAYISGGGTSGYGLFLNGKGTSHGLFARSGSGATGDGANFTSIATNGNGLGLVATGSGVEITGDDLIDLIWNEDTTGHKTDPQMGFFITQGGEVSITDADMISIKDTIYGADTTSNNGVAGSFGQVLSTPSYVQGAASGVTVASIWGEVGVAGTVEDSSSNSSTMVQTNLAEATDDHYNGMAIIFLNGNEANQARRIVDYDGGNGYLIFTPALTGTPASGDSLRIVWWADVDDNGIGLSTYTLLSVDTLGTDSLVGTVRVTMTNNGTGDIIGPVITDASTASVAFGLDNAEYTLAASRDGYVFLSKTITISASVTDTVEGYNVPVSASGGSSTCAVTVNVKDHTGSAAVGVPVYAYAVGYGTLTDSSGAAITNRPTKKTTNSSGQVVFTCIWSSYLIPASDWRFTIGSPSGSTRKTITIPRQSSYTIDLSN